MASRPQKLQGSPHLLRSWKLVGRLRSRRVGRLSSLLALGRQKLLLEECEVVTVARTGHEWAPRMCATSSVTATTVTIACAAKNMSVRSKALELDSTAISLALNKSSLDTVARYRLSSLGDGPS